MPETYKIRPPLPERPPGDIMRTVESTTWNLAVVEIYECLPADLFVSFLPAPTHTRSSSNLSQQLDILACKLSSQTIPAMKFLNLVITAATQLVSPTLVQTFYIYAVSGSHNTMHAFSKRCGRLTLIAGQRRLFQRPRLRHLQRTSELQRGLQDACLPTERGG